MVEGNKLAAALVAKDLALPEVIERILRKNSGNRKLLLVIDQFEELYTLCDDHRERQEWPTANNSSSLKPEEKIKLQEISEKAGKSLTRLIQKYRLPQLEAELKQGKFGKITYSNTTKSSRNSVF